ncbi:MAG: DUF2478 domain-containing protein [Silicimonas sp.]
MKLAYVTVPGRGRIDDLVAEVVGAFEDDGLRLAGTARVKPADPSGHPCDMDLRVLPDGPGFRISQPLGPMAKGCRLDGGVIEAIAAEVEARLSGADLLVVNKFGKLEAQGRGLCPAITMAMEMGIPTLVGVNEMNVPEFNAFSDGAAEVLKPDVRSIRAWYEKARAPLLLAAV